MPFEPGGYADKLGNRHEGRWIVLQLLRLLYELYDSVTVEAIGDDEIGVDLWIEKSKGIREAQQCKARNSSKESWTIADLKSRGILDNMKFQLDRDPNHQFALVTGVPASLFSDLCESARLSNNNSEDFYQYQIDAIGSKRRKVFQQFCEAIGLNFAQASDRKIAFDYLRRTYIHQWHDDQNSWDQLLTFTGLLASGDTEQIISALAQYAEDNIRKPLTSDLVRQHLINHGFAPRNLSYDHRIAPIVEMLKGQFEESIAPDLIAGDLISRSETNLVLDALSSGGFVIIHGIAGSGKSGILYELTTLLHKQGHPYLPIRLDRNIPHNTTKQLGADLGLPESPAICLASLIGDNFGVLILDQLDALRWTSKHSLNSLSVCKTLVREIESLRVTGRQVRVVLVCRTFDLEHDPEIAGWIESAKHNTWTKVGIRGLPEVQVKAVVEGAGHRYFELTSRQKQILQSPQHLGMWVKLTKSGNQAGFKNSVQLLEMFWANCLREFEKVGLPTKDAEAVLNLLIDYMELKSRLYAPEGLVKIYLKETDILCSKGILQKANGKITFRHQSYLDYLVSRRLLDNIYKGQGSITKWLGTKSEQSLFRREQLRHILSLVSLESQDDFLSVLQAILTEKEIRFYMKHVALEVTAQVEELQPALQRYLRTLIDDDYWGEHILSTVLFGNPHHVRWLLQLKIIKQWLLSKEQIHNNIALWLLRSVNGPLSLDLAETLEPFIEESQDWALAVLDSIDPRGDIDSEPMFELRLKLARKGLLSSWTSWKQLSKNYPMRVLQLIEAGISTLTDEDLRRSIYGFSSNYHSTLVLDDWSEEEIISIKYAAAEHPESTWRLLMPHVERLTANAINGTAERYWHDPFTVRNTKSIAVVSGIMQMIIVAGKKLANENPELLFLLAEPYKDSNASVIQLILVEIYAEMPPTYADRGISWLLSNSAHLLLGSGFHEPKWMPSVRLIQRLSPICTELLFEKLETFIVSYHEPDELKKAKAYLQYWKHGYKTYFWGEAQYFLLPALCSSRRSRKCEDLIQILERKFAGRSDESFLYLSGNGGFRSVVSSIPADRLEMLSDHTWLQIVNQSLPLESSSRWKEVGEHYAESSVTYFAGDLHRVAAKFPERFGQLALQFPMDVHPEYIAAVLGGFGNAVPPQALPEHERVNWQPARREVVEAVLDRYNFYDDTATATNLCHLIERRASEPWSISIITRLVKYAISHPDPISDVLNVGSDKSLEEVTVEHLYQKTINCVRGIAAHAIAVWMNAHPSRIAEVQPAINSLLFDEHPSVRMAAIEVCIAYLGINDNKAVEYFLRAVHGDLRVAASPRATVIFNHTASSHHEELAPLIRQMLGSEHDDVVEQAASEVTARWIFYDFFANEVEACLVGSVYQRKGVAKIASNFIGQENYSTKCKLLLSRLLNDSDPKVLEAVNHAFYNAFILYIPDADNFVHQYINSPAYKNDPSPLLHTLERHTGSILPYSNWLLAICKVFSGPLREQSRDIQTGIAADAFLIPSLILRLYEQAHEQQELDTANLCLDAWDMLFESRVGRTRELAKSMMQ